MVLNKNYFKNYVINIFQINQLSEEFCVKSNESIRQKEEITHLLAQVFPFVFTIVFNYLVEILLCLHTFISTAKIPMALYLIFLIHLG